MNRSMTVRRQRGFTLIELMMVVMLAAIMVGIAVPSFREFMAAQRVKNTAFDFAAAMLLARSEAVKRNTPVSMAQIAATWQGWTVAVGGATLSTREATAEVTITPNDPAYTSIDFLGNGRVANTMRFQFSAPNTDAVRCVTLGASGVPNTTTTSCS